VRLPFVLVCFVASGCLDFGQVEDAKAPGDMLGIFAVESKLKESSCGDKALGGGERWDFDVKLSRDDRDLYWLNGRESIVGSIESDGRSFSFETRIEQEIIPGKPGRPGCVVARDDMATGRLSDSGSDVDSFSGSLRFRFRALEGSDCSSWIGSEGAVSALPCSMTYSMNAERKSDD
jgi:hypothetical protein